MKILVLSGYGIKLGFRKGMFIVTKNGQKIQEVSPFEIEQIVLTTSGIAITSKALRTCGRLGIDLVILDHKGNVIARLLPPYITKTVETRRLQYLAYNDVQGIKIAKWVLKCKLINQNEVLKYFAKCRKQSIIYEKLRTNALDHERYIYEIDSITSKILDNWTRQRLLVIEANAARIYWDSIKLLLPNELGFKGRDPESLDVVNIVLNYGYGLLKNLCMKYAMMLNFDPFAGYLHIDKSGRPSLVLDVMEIFRPITVDRFFIQYLCHNWKNLLNAIENGRLKPEFRTELIKLFNEVLKKNCRFRDENLTYEQLIIQAFKVLKRFLHGESELEIIKVKLI